MSREDLNAISIGGTLFLVYLLYWVLRMSSLGLIADVFFIVGFIGFGYLTWFYVKDNHSRKKLAISLAGGIVLCVVLTLMMIIAAASSTTVVGGSVYTISVQGLAKYQGGLTTTIIVPLPMVNEHPLFSDEDLQNQTFGRWTSTLVMTDDGKMLAFQTRGPILTDIRAEFSRVEDIRVIQREIQSVRFSPVVDAAPAGESKEMCGSGIIAEQSTMVFVDDTIRSIDGTNHSITFDIDFRTGGGVINGIQTVKYRARVSEIIAGGMAGPIPVKAQICRS
ncbi:MAG: hypothetical protein QMD46_13755 [Methanomicrobiales archaeon]|nr:hypothetical protein [Methanomicrobiales archaeon]